MIKDGIEFTYKVVSIDIESAHMVVEYTPADSELMPLTLNVPVTLYTGYNPFNGEPDPRPAPVTLEDYKEFTALSGAPTGLWKTQKVLLQLFN